MVFLQRERERDEIDLLFSILTGTGLSNTDAFAMSLVLQSLDHQLQVYYFPLILNFFLPIYSMFINVLKNKNFGVEYFRYFPVYVSGIFTVETLNKSS
jgi:hypothetical protein